MERSDAGTKERSPEGLSGPNQNTILINIIWYNFKRYGKSTVKCKDKQNGLKQSKNETSSTLHRWN